MCAMRETIRRELAVVEHAAAGPPSVYEPNPAKLFSLTGTCRSLWLRAHPRCAPWRVRRDGRAPPSLGTGLARDATNIRDSRRDGRSWGARAGKIGHMRTPTEDDYKNLEALRAKLGRTSMAPQARSKDGLADIESHEYGWFHEWYARDEMK